MSKPGVPEFWVCRVLMHEGRRVQLHLLPAGIGAAVEAEVDAGAYCLLPDGAICEPVECYPDEANAHTARETLATSHPAEDFRVIMTVLTTKELARG